MPALIQFRRDTASNWTSNNPTLANGEFAIESDTTKYKIGDGSTAWTSLAYGGLGSIDTAIIDAKEVSDENQTFRILWKFMVNQKWRPLSNSTWNYNPKQRQLAIVAEVSDLGRMRILSFSEQIK